MPSLGLHVARQLHPHEDEARDKAHCHGSKPDKLEINFVIESNSANQFARNKEFSLIPFVTPQIFRRYTVAQDLCKKLRVENETDYYTVRIGMSDVIEKGR